MKWKGESFVRFREETIDLIRKRWLFLTLATLAGHLTVFIVFLVSVRAVVCPGSVAVTRGTPLLRGMRPKCRRAESSAAFASMSPTMTSVALSGT